MRRLKISPGEEFDPIGKWLLWDTMKEQPFLMKPPGWKEKPLFCLFSDLLKLRAFADAKQIPATFMQITREGEFIDTLDVDEGMFDPTATLEPDGKLLIQAVVIKCWLGDPLGQQTDSKEP